MQKNSQIYQTEEAYDDIENIGGKYRFFYENQSSDDDKEKSENEDSDNDSDQAKDQDIEFDFAKKKRKHNLKDKRELYLNQIKKEMTPSIRYDSP